MHTPSSIEPLEARIAPATFTVITTADAGAGSLRQAILDANATGDPDTIAFAIAGTGVQTIALASPLPNITGPVVIDGTTQPGYVAGSAPRIEVSGAGLSAGSHGFTVGANNSKITALTINRFPGAGIHLTGAENAVERSYIGLDAAGTAAAGNGVGLLIEGSDNVIGGVEQGFGNVISGNLGAGIHFTRFTSFDNVVLRNIIGVAPNLSDFVPNAIGVFFEADPHDNAIGSSGSGLGNDIGGNTGAGVAFADYGRGNAVSGNNISGNGGLGIDILNDGPTLNNTGAQQHYPVLTEALVGGGRTLIRGTLTSTFSSAFQVQFFANAAGTADPSGFGEGRNFLGSAFVTTDATGVASFSTPVPFEVAAGNFVTATALDAAGNTSEFSTNRLVGDGLRAPTIAADGRSATFTDADGDRVTLAVSKGRLGATDFTLVAAGSGSGAQLVALNFADDGAEFSGANITLAAKRTALGGDGFVNLGYLNATGVDLGAVKITGDLGRVDAGSGTVGVFALRGLSVQSMGRYSGDTDFPGSSPFSTINGHAGTISVAGDFIGSGLLVGGNLATLAIGRNVFGVDASLPGFISVGGKLFSGRIGGDLSGGADLSTGRLNAGSIGVLTIGGSVVGGDGNSSGAITTNTGGIEKLVIRGSLIGSPTAAVGDPNGTVRAVGAIGSLSIGRDLIGGSADNSGYLFAQSIGTITVGGSIKGGPSFFSGGLESATTIGQFTIRGSLLGSAGERSGSILGQTGLGRVIVSGSMEGGAGNGSATIESGGGITSVSIGDSTRGGAGVFSAAITATARIGTVTIGGSLETPIASQGTIGSVSVRGDFYGLVGARGALNPATVAGALAIGKVTIGGNFSGAIFAGWDYLAGWNNPDVTIGSISIGGNAGTIRVSAGIDPGANAGFADGDDFVVAGGSGSLFSQIGSIVVRGQVGRSEIGTHLGFTAERIGKLQIGATKYPLTAGTDRFDLGILGNVSLREA